MARLFIEIKKEIAEVRARLKNQIDWLREKSTPLGKMSIQLHKSVITNFQTESSDEGRDWRPMAASTRYAKAHRKKHRSTNPRLLQDTSLMRTSIFPGVTDDTAYASENVPYAPVQHFGSRDKRIPSRKFFTIRKTQLARIKTIARIWAFTGRTE